MLSKRIKLSILFEVRAYLYFSACEEDYLTYPVSQVHEVNSSLFVGVVAIGAAGNVDIAPVDRLQESTEAHLAMSARSLL